MKTKELTLEKIQRLASIDNQIPISSLAKIIQAKSKRGVIKIIKQELDERNRKNKN